MNHRSGLNEIAQFLENQRKQTLQEASVLDEKTDEQLKKIIHEARMQQHCLVLGSIAEIENTRKIEHATSLLEARAAGISAKKETKFHEKLDTLVHDTFGKRKEEKAVEESESLEEISKTTLASYMEKSKKQSASLLRKYNNDKATPDDEKKMDRRAGGQIAAYDRFHGRSKTPASGVNKDYDRAQRMSKNESESLDELSKNTLGSYINKATKSAAISHASAQAKRAGAAEVDRFTNRHMEDKFKTQDDMKKKMGVDNDSIEKDADKARSRIRGIGSAVKRLVKEALENLDEAAKDHTIEAHGTRGMKNTPWRKTFKHVDHLNKWAEENDSVEVIGTRDLKSAKKGNLSPAVRESEELDEVHNVSDKEHEDAITGAIENHPKNKGPKGRQIAMAHMRKYWDKQKTLISKFPGDADFIHGRSKALDAQMTKTNKE